MPPKKKGAAAGAENKKTTEKKKEKVIEDKTFGLKNKKGKKQQHFIKQVTTQVKYGGQQSVAKREQVEHQQKQKKAEDRKAKEEMISLFRPVQTQKVSAGADPKSQLCIFFKQGQCTKGDKCKFSHDLSLEGKAEKRSMYVDARDLEDDTMDKWDEDKLKEVVDKKHGAVQTTRPKTDIVCKHFLHAIEKGIYGWFWECPNGGDKCMYRHALPPGFVFKRQTQEKSQEETVSLEELVEKERSQLLLSGNPLTKVTLESFMAWKERKLKEKRDKADDAMLKRKEAFKAGRTHGISGREMFEFNPLLVVGDDQEAGDDGDVVYFQRNDDEDEEAVDVTGVPTAPEVPTSEAPPTAQGTREELKDEAESVGAVGGYDRLQDEASAGFDLQDRELEPQDEEEEEVVVDESLFDVENLEDLNVDDELEDDNIN